MLQYKAEALIDSVKTRNDKNGEVEATITLKVRCQEPETELAPLLGMLRTYVAVSVSEAQCKPASMGEI